MAAAPRPSDRDPAGTLAAPADRCPGEPETLNNYKDDDGCPDALPADLAAVLGVLPNVEFKPYRRDLLPSSYPTLDHIAEVLRRYPQFNFEIANHEDYAGPDDHGHCLTCWRAEDVKRYLVEHGVDIKQLEAVGRGPDEPIDSNKTPAGRKRNRRTELTLQPARD